MGRSCDRVFGNSDFRSEIAADEIDILSELSSRSRNREPMQVVKKAGLRRRGRESVSPRRLRRRRYRTFQSRPRGFSQPHNQIIRRRTDFRWKDGKVHDNPSVSLLDGEIPAPGIENERVLGIAEVTKENVGRSESGMAQQVDFTFRGEPS